ncbi:hypothetical protein [Paractinoplanes rishiriensis]|uniref:Uncharacterized protein n=1 Tax=Paractinoplanes rishiriensis TaxID=1050105 RepID=A0A919JYL6_9ACTN|nr:hypothetical protein [Actinoplanes rishiriensis]GIE95614.1 hypothetical protein Ari01nite_30790 [Actinoplanes rishiriensis]
MPSEADLFRALDDEPPTPSTVSVQRAIATGRRHRARRNAGYAGAAALTAVAVAGVSVAGNLVAGPPGQPAATGPTPSKTVPSKAGPSEAPAKPAYTIPGTPGWNAPPASPPSRCTIEKLPVPRNVRMALISGADPTGRYLVGRSYPPGGGYQAVIWADGKGREVPLPGDSEELLTDANSAGVAVGWSYTEKGQLPYVYRDGKVSKLPGVKEGQAIAINEAGAIVGDSGGPGGGRVLVWPSPTAKPIKLPLPAGAQSASAGDIDEDGTVVGMLDYETPYVWFADGTHRELPVPDIDGKPAETASVIGVRNGWAIGTATNGMGRKGEGAEGGKMVSVRWNIRTGEVQELAGRVRSLDAVNAQGWVIGTGAEGHAVLAAGGTTVKLPALAAHQPDGLSNIANALSDDGRTIAGQSDDASGTIRAVIWRCQ